MLKSKYKCLTCSYIGNLNFDYDTEQDVTYASFQGRVSCESCHTSIECQGELDILEGEPVDNPMDYLMNIYFEEEFDKHFVEISELNDSHKGPLDHLCK
ncbi:hypothetical protein BCT19_12970 [Vibrio splendidus]|uniref:hypothetical protein n=1 Tax=Vibrio splendidus TaxID=29497 RepID=UPI000C8456D5|nr:hypothetical protein [Vibrio splendidus]MCC5518804.1 hypothetical protein [Vibrio splendidus]PMO05381.1 hypothetical protein BCT19_12970 [Vibrio splendidus]